MDLTPTADQVAVTEAAGAFLDDQLPLSRLRELLDQPSSLDRKLWAGLAELGWFGIDIAEELGGSGYTVVEQVLLFREAGRRLTPGPLVATALGARVATAAGEHDLAARIIDGTTVVGLGLLATEPSGGDAGVPDGPLTADLDLLDAVDADLVLVADAGRAVLVEKAALSGVAAVPCLDDASRLETARAEGVQPVAAVAAATDRVFERGALLTAAMLVGVGEAVRDDAVGFAATRVQFDKPIGANQAIKHRCADIATRIDLAWSQLRFAALSVAAGRSDATFQVSAAKIVATDAVLQSARDNVQIHGGMGFTFEADAHLYVKRTHVLDQSFGNGKDHRVVLMAQPAPLD